MANQSFREIAGLVLLRCPAASLTLAQSWVQQAWRDLVERRRWSFMLRRGYLSTVNQYNTGTATITVGTPTVTITTGVVSSAHVGLQFRIGTSMPIFTIIAIDAGANTYTLSDNWYPSTQTAQTYSVYQAYIPVPTDFHAFVSVIDPANAQPIDFGASVIGFDLKDPQRAAAGAPPQGLGYFDYYNGLPRYEFWPHQRSAYIYPITYEAHLAEPWDAGASIPANIPADIILERALMYCAMWPGPDETHMNPYFSPKLGLAQMHKGEYEHRLAILEKQDNEHMQQDITYQSDQARHGVISGTWMQSHDLAS